MTKSKRKLEQIQEDQKKRERDSLDILLKVDFYNLAYGLEKLKEFREVNPKEVESTLFCGRYPTVHAYGHAVLRLSIHLWDESNCALPMYRGGFAQCRIVIGSIDDSAGYFDGPIESPEKATKRFEAAKKIAKAWDGFCPEKEDIEELKQAGFSIDFN